MKKKKHIIYLTKMIIPNEQNMRLKYNMSRLNRTKRHFCVLTELLWGRDGLQCM